jgi:hypothetical protein
VNLKQDNMTAALLEAVAIVNAFASSPFKEAGIQLEALEVGNEPDQYPRIGARSSTYDTQYVSECVLIF